MSGRVNRRFLEGPWESRGEWRGPHGGGGLSPSGPGLRVAVLFVYLENTRLRLTLHHREEAAGTALTPASAAFPTWNRTAIWKPRENAGCMLERASEGRCRGAGPEGRCRGAGPSPGRVTWSSRGHLADRGGRGPPSTGACWEDVAAGAPVKAVTLLPLPPGRHSLRP